MNNSNTKKASNITNIDVLASENMLKQFQTKYGTPSFNNGTGTSNSSDLTNQFQTKYGTPSFYNDTETYDFSEFTNSPTNMTNQFQTKYGTPSCNNDTLFDSIIIRTNINSSK